jgi:hypothetical protein
MYVYCVIITCARFISLHQFKIDVISPAAQIVFVALAGALTLCLCMQSFQLFCTCIALCERTLLRRFLYRLPSMTVQALGWLVLHFLSGSPGSSGTGPLRQLCSVIKAQS